MSESLAQEISGSNFVITFFFSLGGGGGGCFF